MTDTEPALNQPARYARVVVGVGNHHLDRPFDYALPPDADDVALGRRVRVPFAGRLRTGYVLDVVDTPATDPARVKPIKDVQGDVRWFDKDDLRLYQWVARRYAASLADVLRHALPTRVVAVEKQRAAAAAKGGSEGLEPQAARSAAPACPAAAWRPYHASALLNATSGRGAEVLQWLQPAADEDVTALVMDLVARCIAEGRGALVLAPDPASPLPAAALDIAGTSAADLRSNCGDRARYRAFLRLRAGEALVAAGERSAVFAPVPNLGLVVVADEANPAYKERRAPRHHAREVALARARMAGASALLLGDVPSPHVQRLLTQGHVERLDLDRAAERERAPRVEVVDLSDPRPGTRRARFTSQANRAIAQSVAAGGVIVVVVALRGEGAALACTRCGDRRTCDICGGSIRTARRQANKDSSGWECPSCGWHGARFGCRTCGDTRTAPLAAGTKRFAEELASAYPSAAVVPMEGFDAEGPTARPAIAVMTRGSVVSNPSWLGDDTVDAVIIPDADTLLHRPAVDAAEDTLRLWFTVARWTRRVILQTSEPTHHAVQALVRWDARGFWDRELPWRSELGYPPAASLIQITGPPRAASSAAAELKGAVNTAVDVLGPDPEGGILVKTHDLRGTLAELHPLREAWSKADAKIRVDVDPVDDGGPSSRGP